MGFLSDFLGGGGQTQQPGFVDPAQAPFLQFLRQQGQSQFGQAQGGFNQLPGFAQQLGQQGQGFLNQLGGATQGLNQFIGQGSTDQQIAGVTGVAQDFLNKNINNISGQSNLAGGFGGGRSQVLQGAATGQAAAGLGGVTADILGQDMFRRQQAQGLQGQLAGLGSQLPGGLFDLQQAGLLGQFGGLNQLSGLIGQPTTLGGGGQTTSPGLGFNFLSALGGATGSALGGRFA